MVEETTTESSDDEVVAPSQVTAKEGAGSLGSLEVGAPGQALTYHAVVGSGHALGLGSGTRPVLFPGALGRVLTAWLLS